MPSYLLLILGIGLVVEIGLVVWMVIRSKRSSSDLAKCGQCGYAVRGVSTFECPECGTDLREAGIVKPQNSKSAVRAIVLVSTIGGLVILAMLFFLLLARDEPSLSKTATSTGPANVRTGASPVSPATVKYLVR